MNNFDSLFIQPNIIKCLCGKVIHKFIIKDLTNEFNEYKINNTSSIFKKNKKYSDVNKAEKKKYPFRMVSVKDLGWKQINLTDTLRADIWCDKCLKVSNKLVLSFIQGELVFYGVE